MINYVKKEKFVRPNPKRSYILNGQREYTHVSQVTVVFFSRTGFEYLFGPSHYEFANVIHEIFDSVILAQNQSFD